MPLLVDFSGLAWPSPPFQSLTHFPYATLAPLAAVLVWFPGWVGLPEFRALLRNQPFLLLAQPPTGFTARSYETSFFPVLHGLAWCWAPSLTRYLPDFYPLHVNEGLPIPPATIPSPPLRP